MLDPEWDEFADMNHDLGDVERVYVHVSWC